MPCLALALTGNKEWTIKIFGLQHTMLSSLKLCRACIITATFTDRIPINFIDKYVHILHVYLEPISCRSYKH